MVSKEEYEEAKAELQDLMATGGEGIHWYHQRLQDAADIMDQYEKEHYPIDPPDPIAALEFRVDQEVNSENELHKALIEYFFPWYYDVDDPRIGWVGRGASHIDLFQCEVCKEEHLDYSLISHKEGCSAKKLRDLLIELRKENVNDN